MCPNIELANFSLPKNLLIFSISFHTSCNVFGLREIIAGDIFKVGTMIESKGREGKVIRRGANHLICLDENQNMFRCWVSEAKEPHFMLPVDF